MRMCKMALAAMIFWGCTPGDMQTQDPKGGDTAVDSDVISEADALAQTPDVHSPADTGKDDVG
ncbi:MAG: hypothetical protein H0U74_13905 [Bradymonadaceae bacterium]|nr:hypothetical protein [Lujinxingiaceae bacterium]